MAGRTGDRRKGSLRKLGGVLLFCGVVGVGSEWVLRRYVPACGVTPFQISEVPGLASEFRPGFETLYKGYPLRINSDGYRGAEFPPREPDVLRIALVGDSFTFGTAIDEEDTLARRLESSLLAAGQRAQVLNFGVPGYCALNVATVLEEHAIAQDPDWVVYIWYANDLDPLPYWDEIPPDAVIDGLYGYPLHSALLQWCLVQTKLVGLMFDVQLARRTPEYSRHYYVDGGGGERVREALVRMYDACRKNGVRFAMATYPDLTRSDLNPFRPVDALALQDAEALGIQALDLVESFGDELDLTTYWASVFDHHPDGVANGLVADYLVQKLWR